MSPIIAGRAVKGPTAKMMRELGLEASAGAVARRYGDLLDALRPRPRGRAASMLEMKTATAGTLMVTLADREALARAVLAAADALQEAAR